MYIYIYIYIYFFFFFFFFLLLHHSIFVPDPVQHLPYFFYIMHLFAAFGVTFQHFNRALYLLMKGASHHCITWLSTYLVLGGMPCLSKQSPHYFCGSGSSFLGRSLGCSLGEWLWGILPVLSRTSASSISIMISVNWQHFQGFRDIGYVGTAILRSLLLQVWPSSFYICLLKASSVFP